MFVIVKDVLYIDNLGEAAVLLKFVRLDILKRLDAPSTCLDLMVAFGEATQRIDMRSC